MLKKIVVFLFAASVCAFAYSQKVNIIPAPASVTELNEEGFSLNQKTVLYIDTKGEEMEVAKFLQESFSSAFGTKLRTIDKKKLFESFYFQKQRLEKCNHLCESIGQDFERRRLPIRHQ